MAAPKPTFIKRIISVDETLVYECTRNPNICQVNRECAETEKSCNPSSKKKAVLTMSINYNGVVYHEFLLEGQTVNWENYLTLIRYLDEVIR